ncbi:MAG: DegV family protein [Clostridia bacterium]|nr:DegV family protein [Clostridia bacterium]
MTQVVKKVKLLADSSCDLLSLEGIDYASVPLTISAGNIDYIDNETLDTNAMLDALMAYKGRSYTACPGVEQWLREFEGADELYIATITSGLSGTYNAACAARDIHLQSHPNAKICVFDTLSTGPEMRLFVEKIASMVKEHLPFEEICEKAKDYLKSTRLFFVLESLHCLAQNGRVSKLTASAVEMLGMRLIGTASTEGTLEVLTKVRGKVKAKLALINHLKDALYKGGRLAISYVESPEFARSVKDAILAEFPNADISLHPARGLCSYYAERGGLLLGCECES